MFQRSSNINANTDNLQIADNISSKNFQKIYQLSCQLLKLKWRKVGQINFILKVVFQGQDLNCAALPRTRKVKSRTPHKKFILEPNFYHTPEGSRKVIHIARGKCSNKHLGEKQQKSIY